jgi:hypothetical protein
MAHALVPLHVASHAHALPQRTRLHAPAPAQATVQRPAPHRTSSAQLPVPVHWMSQLAAAWQLAPCWQAWSPHMTRHATVPGHRTSAGQLNAALQSITHTPRSQVPALQAARHAALSGASIAPAAASGPADTCLHRPAIPAAAHQPSAPQTWPPPQSVELEHSTVQSRSFGL